MNDEKCLEGLCKQGAQWLLERDSASPEATEILHENRVKVCTNYNLVFFIVLHFIKVYSSL